MENAFHNAYQFEHDPLEIMSFQTANSTQNAVKINGLRIFLEKWTTQQNNFTTIVSHLAYEFLFLSLSIVHG